MTALFDPPTKPSSMCRRDEHTRCASLSARCACACHPNGVQMPPTTTRPAAINATRRPDPPRPALTPVDDESATPAPRRSNGPAAEPKIELVWEEPPAPTTFGRKPLRDRLAPVLDQVKERPQKWARVALYDRKSSGGSAVTALRKKPPTGSWEFRHAGTASGGSALYARYLGD